MSEEEKKAIEYLTKWVHWETAGERNLEGDIETALNLIEKQKEEIKELNKEFALNTEIHKRDEEIKELKDTIKCLHEPAENYISKDKIRDRIEQLESYYDSNKETTPTSTNQFIIDVVAILEELLEEK